MHYLFTPQKFRQCHASPRLPKLARLRKWSSRDWIREEWSPLLAQSPPWNFPGFSTQWAKCEERKLPKRWAESTITWTNCFFHRSPRRTFSRLALLLCQGFRHHACRKIGRYNLPVFPSYRANSCRSKHSSQIVRQHHWYPSASQRRKPNPVLGIQEKLFALAHHSLLWSLRSWCLVEFRRSELRRLDSYRPYWVASNLKGKLYTRF